MSKRKRERMKAKEKRHQRNAASENAVVQEGKRSGNVAGGSGAGTAPLTGKAAASAKKGSGAGRGTLGEAVGAGANKAASLQRKGGANGAGASMNAVSGRSGGAEELALADAVTGSSGATRPRRGRPKREAASDASTSSRPGNRGGTHAAAEAAQEKESLAGASAAGPSRSRGRGKAKQEPVLKLDFEQSPHLRDMTLPWQQFYSAVRSSFIKE